MSFRLPILALAALLMAAAAPDAAPAGKTPRVLSDAGLAHARSALKHVGHKRWREAQYDAGRAGEPLVAKLVEWRRLADDGSGASFTTLAAFIDANPRWPGLATLRRNAEKAMPGTMADREVVAWFERHPPESPTGKRRFAEALLAAGDAGHGLALIRDAWVNGDFDSRQEKAFLAGHAKRLRPEDHVARLDRLLWDARVREAERQMPRVDDAHRRLALARIRLMAQAGGVDPAVARVPPALAQDVGLIYERLRWRRRAGFDDGARELLDAQPADPVRAGRWWTERHILARRALDTGAITAAYRAAARHGQAGPAEIAEAEWLAGWIALRFLDEPLIAYQHFVDMHQVVAMPISIARAAYWAGRAADAAGVPGEAERWYRRAATQPTAFYGQLALLALGADELTLPADPVPGPNVVAAFERDELVRLARILGELGEADLMSRVIARIIDDADSPALGDLAARLGLDYGLAPVAIRASKYAQRQGVATIAPAYPVPPAVASHLQSDSGRLEPGLMLAVARQESEMNPNVVSSAGARGLMQLMPPTAAMVAKRLGMPYDAARLNGDPRYSLRLGGDYLAGLIDDFSGATVLAVTGYNAGPSRVRQWMRQNGDPRDADVDVIDWIELIPFNETRNYVQRVLEGTQVYRVVLSEQAGRARLRLGDDIGVGPGRLAGR